MSVRPSLAASALSVDEMVSRHFLGSVCTDLPEMQTDNIFWVEEELHGGKMQNFKFT